MGTGESLPVIRLDEIVGSDPVHLIKIDTDGFEFHVLQGLTETLSRDSPYLFMAIMYLTNTRLRLP
jgi:FkbM family methyltransferase